MPSTRQLFGNLKSTCETLLAHRTESIQKAHVEARVADCKNRIKYSSRSAEHFFGRKASEIASINVWSMENYHAPIVVQGQSCRRVAHTQGLTNERLHSRHIDTSRLSHRRQACGIGEQYLFRMLKSVVQLGEIQLSF